MSWEASDPALHPCPCGKATYSIVLRSDDWGRVQQRWEMQCPSCKNSHGLYVSQYKRKGMHVQQHFWVRREVLDRVATAEHGVRSAQNKLDSYLETKYSELWRARFAGKSKKAIWQELVADGRTYPSLAAFYSHVRQDGLEKSMLRYLRHDEVKTLVRILNVNDQHIEKALVEIAHLEIQAQEVHGTARQRSDA